MAITKTELNSGSSGDSVISAKNVTREYLGGSFTAVHNMSMNLPEGQVTTFVGPSGCGKTVMLRMIAGLEDPTKGSISCYGKPVRGPGPDRGMIFQAYTSFPWLTALQNVEYGMKLLGIPKAERREKARQLLIEVHLGGFENAYPSELSGGMKQRVAIARTLAQNPAVLLMDEPFGALDALTREEMALEILRIWTDQPKTILFVTHSITEAVLLADRVVVMSARPGRIAEIIDVDLPRPRTFEIEAHHEFQQSTQRIRELIFGNRSG